MNASNFSIEFELNVIEIKKLNKMYFKNLYRNRVRIFLGAILLFSMFFNFLNWDDTRDLIEWAIRNLALVMLFVLFQYSFVNTICNLLFQLIKKLLKFEKFIRKYKFNFNNSFIRVHTPLGEFVHKWSQIEKAILTKEFFLLYVKENNGYVISISNKYKKGRNMEKLIDFVEHNVTQITKV